MDVLVGWFAHETGDDSRSQLFSASSFRLTINTSFLCSAHCCFSFLLLSPLFCSLFRFSISCMLALHFRFCSPLMLVPLSSLFSCIFPSCFLSCIPSSSHCSQAGLNQPPVKRVQQKVKIEGNAVVQAYTTQQAHMQSVPTFGRGS